MEKLYFSPGMDCLNAIIDSINNAKSSLRICVFTITDNRIVSAIEAAKLRGVDIKIITDNDKRFDRGSDIIYLDKKGYNIKIDYTDSHMHHKFAVIDKKVIITGSYNWTRSAEKYNHENVLVSDSEYLAETYMKEFNRLWDSLKEL